MFRFFAFAPLLVLLSACLVLTDDTSNPTSPVTPVKPAPSVVVPGDGSYTYSCTGGTLVVNYLSGNAVRVFYDGAFRDLRLVSTGGSYVYSNGPYTWNARGRGGSLAVGGNIVLNNCVY